MDQEHQKAGEEKNNSRLNRYDETVCGAWPRTQIDLKNVDRQFLRKIMDQEHWTERNRCEERG